MNQRKLLKTALFAFCLIVLSSVVFGDLIDGQVSYYKGDVNGSYPDAHDGNNGSIVGATFTNSGKINGAYSFDGGDTILISDHSSLDLTQNISVFAWINISTNPANGAFYSVVGKGYTAPFSGAYQLWYVNNWNGEMGVTCLSYNGAYHKTSSGALLSNNTWYHVGCVWNGTNINVYLDGVLNTTLADSTAIPINNKGLRIANTNWDGAPLGYFVGVIDEVGIWNRPLNSTEISELNNSGDGLQYPYKVFDPVFLPPSPSNDSTNNTQVTFNISCSNGNVYSWFNGSTVIDNQSSPANYTTNVSNSAIYYYNAACYNSTFSGFTSNITRMWTYDIISPTITINPDNAFNQNNYSQISQYLDYMLLNLTFNDNIDLYAYSINITKNVVTVMYNETNESISGTEFNYTKNLNTSNWLYGWYDIELRLSDSHTINKIESYNVTKSNKLLNFETIEGNNIEISTDDNAITDSQKYVDRYDFSFNFSDKQDKARVFHVKSDNKIIYRPKSDYKAHFVVFNGFDGNWIDFDGVGGNPTIIKVSDYHYELRFSYLPSTVSFNSIGGLNIITSNYRWYKGTATKTVDTIGVNESFYINLSLTRDSSHNNFSAFLVYNGTTYANPNKTDDGSTVDWFQNLTSPLTGGIIPYHWNITYNQTDTTSINFIINGTHTVLDWGVFNCSSGNISLVITIFDENYPTTQRNATVDLQILSWLTNPDNYHTFEEKLEGNSTYNICLYPVNETLQINYYAQYTTDTGFTHRYYLYNFSITNTSQNISMYNTNKTTGYSELVITARRTENYQYFENVVAKLQRRYVDEGVWRTVQMDQSGDFGIIIFHILEQNTDYKIIYYDTDNNLLKETETLKFSCTDAKCELTQLLDESVAAAIGENISVTSSLNNVTNILTVTWVDPAANNNDVEVRVTKQTLTGELTICDVFQTGASGVVNCNVTGYTGDILLTVLTSNSPYTPITSEWISLERSGLFEQMDSAESAFWTSGVMITTIGFGLWSPVAALVAAIFGLILVFFLGIFKPITITFIIIGAAMGIAAGLKIRK